MSELDLPGGDVTLPGVGKQPILLVAGGAGAVIAIGVIIARRLGGGGDGAPVEAVPAEGEAAPAAPIGSPDPSGAIGMVGDSLRSALQQQGQETSAALAAQQTATLQALAGIGSSQSAAIASLGEILADQNQDEAARDRAAAAAAAARDAAMAKQQQDWWDKVLALINRQPPVSGVVDPPIGGGPPPTTIPGPGQPAPTQPGQPAPTQSTDQAEWRKYAENAGLLKWNVDQKRQLPAGEPLMVYEGNVRKSSKVINLPKAYDGRQDTRRYFFLTTPQEPLLVRAARKTADSMAQNPAQNPQAVMLSFLRREAQSGGGWEGTGFTAGPTDIAAGYP